MQKPKPFFDKVFYQIYPRSFADSNGDGIGDLRGIISKLDYLAELGIDVIWLSPVYKSPLMDMGYDISDYYSIHPDLGTMDDFDDLIKEADRRDIRIVMDLVVNHTSDQHPWFIASKDKNSKYRDYYIYRKGKANGKKPPNNWTSMFTGPAWSRNEGDDEYYLHLYSKQQPDLNWHNEAVVEEVEKILRFYLDKGVYGFRCDVINQIYKESLEDGKGHSFSGRGSEHYLGVEGNHKMLRRLYDDVFSHYDCVVIGETYQVSKECGKRYLENHELDMFFQFDTANCDKIKSLPVFTKKFKPSLLRDAFYSWQTAVSWNANYLENHDQRRSISRFGSMQFHKESGKALGTLLLTLRGSPFIYQGEEIGMTDLPIGDPDKSQDVSCRLVSGIMKKFHFPRKLRYKCCHNINRDNSRSPMQWDKGVSAGFSTSKDTWIKVNDNYLSGINVYDESLDPDSIYNFYKRLTYLRHRDEVLSYGEVYPIKVHSELIAFQRVYLGRRRLVLINLTPKRMVLDRHLVLSGAKLLLSSIGNPMYEHGLLEPYEADIFTIE